MSLLHKVAALSHLSFVWMSQPIICDMGLLSRAETWLSLLISERARRVEKGTLPSGPCCTLRPILERVSSLCFLPRRAAAILSRWLLICFFAGITKRNGAADGSILELIARGELAKVNHHKARAGLPLDSLHGLPGDAVVTLYCEERGAACFFPTKRRVCPVIECIARCSEVGVAVLDHFFFPFVEVARILSGELGNCDESNLSGSEFPGNCVHCFSVGVG